MPAQDLVNQTDWSVSYHIGQRLGAISAATSARVVHARTTFSPRPSGTSPTTASGFRHSP